MLTIADIRNAANAFPENGTAEELINKLLCLYKTEKGLQEAEERKGLSLDDFNKQLDAWWQQKQG